MSKSNVFENDLMKLIFLGEGIPNIADNASIGPLSHLYLALHTSDPGEGGSQTSNEVNYGGYGRIAVPRGPDGWTVTDNVASPAQAVEFGEMVSGTPGTATHISIGTHLEGSGKILYRGALTPSIAFNIGVVPRLRTTSTITED